MPKDPVDPAVSPPIAVRGRIVTMDDAGTVLDDGVVYARDGSVVDVRPAGATPPDGFAGVSVAATKGTVFPGLVELHRSRSSTRTATSGAVRRTPTTTV